VNASREGGPARGRSAAARRRIARIATRSAWSLALLAAVAVAGARAGPAVLPADAPVFPALSADEVAAIVSHGPWPPAFEPDPTNLASGRPAAVELGRRLFADRRVSADGTRSCADCHRPELGFADGRTRSPGADGRPLDRNAPGLLDLRLQAWFGWDGGADSLWAFVLRPLADPREVGATDASLGRLFADDRSLGCLRDAAFGGPAPAGEPLRVQTAKAIAAWLETLQSPRTRFDALRDGLASGDAGALRDYPADALRGLRRFVGDARCALCHVGPAFTSGEFHDAGRPHMAAPGRPDPGRHGGVAAVLADPYNRLGRWSDATDPAAAVRTRHLAPSHRNFGEFRVPGLRGAVATAPYGHDGAMPTLERVIDHYADVDADRLHADGEAILRPLRLDAAGRAELVAFLRTLSEPLEQAAPRPTGDPRAGTGCPGPRGS
jgi:cytochrome c peroxidase